MVATRNGGPVDIHRVLWPNPYYTFLLKLNAPVVGVIHISLILIMFVCSGS